MSVIIRIKQNNAPNPLSMMEYGTPIIPITNDRTMKALRKRPTASQVAALAIRYIIIGAMSIDGELSFLYAQVNTRAIKAITIPIQTSIWYSKNPSVEKNPDSDKPSTAL